MVLSSDFEAVNGGDTVTEGEFQEFLITVGYRYNAKTKTGFNTFEGFHAMIGFFASENRYTFSMDAVTENLPEVLNKLKTFGSENKDHITKIFYKDRQIRMNIKMTVDSEIDRERLKNIVRFVTELCKSELLTPVCRMCGKNRKTGVYIIGSGLTVLCDKCLERKQRQYAHRRDMFIKKKQNMPLGIAGAVFGGLLGMSIYVLLYQIISLWGIWAGIIVICIFSGYVITGKRATRASAVICEIMAFFAFLMAEYAAMVAGMAIEIERQGGGIALTESIETTNTILSSAENISELITEIIVGCFVMVMIGGIYFLKRSFTRPLKISKNLL